MSKRTILLTGSRGYIGQNLVKFLSPKYDIISIVRPETANKDKQQQKYSFEINLDDINKLKDFLKLLTVDAIIHTGTFHYKQGTSYRNYVKTNVDSTEQLIIKALSLDIPLLFYSSLGIFGRKPVELPVCEQTTRNPLNDYHRSKLMSEIVIQNYVMKGLKAAILRPAMLYGIGKFGLPIEMIRNTHKGTFILPRRRVKIHMTNIELLISAFTKLLENPFRSGSSYIIADLEPVVLSDFVDFIAKQLDLPDNYSLSHTIDDTTFLKRMKSAAFFHSDTLFGKYYRFYDNWYYDVIPAFRELNLKTVRTIPEFRTVIEWYKELR